MRPLSIIHAAAGTLALALISSFWLGTTISELSGNPDLILAAKTTIVWALPVLVAAMATAGIAGFRVGGRSKAPKVVTKRRRMPFIGLNGLLVLVPSALFLFFKAGAGEYDLAFYTVQAVELLAGAANVTLLGLNLRDGLAMTAGRRKRRATAS